MPTETFLNLPIEKQQRLMEAAKIEFSRAPLKEASIANIIKLAGIPRGSFYQYFTDKEDLYFYYYDQLQRDTRLEFEEALIAADGDILQAADVYFVKMMTEVLTGENTAFFKNLFMSMDYHSSRRVTRDLDFPENERPMKHKHHHREIHSLWRLVNQEALCFENSREFAMFIRTLMTVVFMVVSHGYRRLGVDENYRVEDSIAEFRTQLNWYRQGIYKQDD
ncbi:AcrR family transcriptional regulator [Enterococcus sp. PF1-24]|uniref:TetR/AcrR family transcriptional regulator n=1 Tax=unclassified Enterococcus TaxID=2608891 RepID=UPI0024747467|nr:MULTISPECIES: TetR family transcriptional regulator [unclassified Enterococcus]MDH6365346.1 AcrR family transcriptional regulator [Enterococcus sp. PFB1-1]MDH6402447.1 AcrR family transcriptional regulator [Enterococcus sp. PF1-24]